MLPGAFPLGPFIVEESGKLTFRTPGNGANFSFHWRGHRFSAVLAQQRVALTGTLGQVPSSATGAGKRQSTLAAIKALPRLLPAGCTLHLTPNHRLQVKASEPMEWPAHATDLMVPLVRFLLTIAPTLDLLDEAGLGPAPG
jgi:hypothetical protein